MTKTGKTVATLVDSGTAKEQIDYAKVREYWESNTITVLDPAGNPLQKQMWSQTIEELYNRYPESYIKTNGLESQFMKHRDNLRMRINAVPGEPDYSDLNIDINDPTASTEEILKKYLEWYSNTRTLGMWERAFANATPSGMHRASFMPHRPS